MKSESGWALLEVVVLVAVLVAPLVWGLGVFAQLQRAAMAATAAAREAGSEAARAANPQQARAAASAAVAVALSNHEVDPAAARVRIRTNGFGRGAAVQVAVRYPVRVLRFPLAGRAWEPSVWVEALHRTRIDPYRSRS